MAVDEPVPGDARFSTWLFRVATNQCLRDIRRRPAQTAQLPDDLAGTGGSPQGELETAEGYAAVSAAVGRLSAEQRAALLLHEVEGLSYDQIAEVLGVSMAAVKSRIYRARTDLARDLSADREPPVTTALWEALPCGADPEKLVEYAAEGADAPGGSHQAGCAVLPGRAARVR